MGSLIIISSQGKSSKEECSKPKSYIPCRQLGSVTWKCHCWTPKKKHHWKVHNQICACKLVTSLTISPSLNISWSSQKKTLPGTRIHARRQMQALSWKHSNNDGFLQQNRYPSLVTLFKNIWKLGTHPKNVHKRSMFLFKKLVRNFGGTFWNAPHETSSFPTKKLISNTKAWSIHLLFCYPILRAYGRHSTCTGRDRKKIKGLILDEGR